SSSRPPAHPGATGSERAERHEQRGEEAAPVEASRRDALREGLWDARLHVAKPSAPLLASLRAVAGGCDRLRAASPYVGHWERGASSPITRVEAPGAVVDGHLYVFGGFDSASLTVSRRVDAY